MILAILEWPAVGLVVAQLYFMSDQKYVTGWICCLLACAAWGIVSLNAEMWGWFLQQIIIAGISIRGLRRELVKYE